MANALNREIQVGEIVVQSKESMKPEYQGLKHRIFVCESGFGMQSFTSGTKIFGYYMLDGEKGYIRGYEISIEETAEVQRYKRDTPLAKLVELIEG